MNRKILISLIIVIGIIVIAYLLIANSSPQNGQNRLLKESKNTYEQLSTSYEGI